MTAASVMVALTVAGVGLLVEVGVHPRSMADGFLVLTCSAFGIITIYRAWQLGARRSGTGLRADPSLGSGSF